MLTIKFRRLHPDAKLPKRWSDEAVGLDIYAHLRTEEGRANNMVLPPRNTRNVPTGLQIETPPGHFCLVCSRSGLAKLSIFVTNGPGIIDPDYRGELQVLLYNGSHETQWIKDGDRIAQLVTLPALLAIEAVAVEELSESGRGESGFGSTGT